LTQIPNIKPNNLYGFSVSTAFYRIINAANPGSIKAFEFLLKISPVKISEKIPAP
jgi:hypothetical protein